MTFYKIKNGLAPSYLPNHLPNHRETNYTLRNKRASVHFVRTDRFENSFFPFTCKAWNELNNSVQSISSVESFKKYLNRFIRPPGRDHYGIKDYYGIRLLTKIRVSFSDLRDHRFNHNFNCANPNCGCGNEHETSVHFFLRCPQFNVQRISLLSKISDIVGSDITVLPDEHLYNILVYGSNTYNYVTNKLIITETIRYIRESGRFTKLEAFG